jgi:methylated-DNA-[protein]-cysteine S-methyltransferase
MTKPQPLLSLYTQKIATPLGDLMLVADRQGRLRALDWVSHEVRLHKLLIQHCQSMVRYGQVACKGFTLEPQAGDFYGLSAALRSYFSGQLSAIHQLPVFIAGTDFQHQVWQALCRIPCGSTLSYAELAASVGRPQARQAVGGANGANPLSIVVPCHRVIASKGHLSGYGGGIERKQWLLTHEGVKLSI